MPAKRFEVKSLYYITHVDNLLSILHHGILAHQRVVDQGLPFTPIYDESIVSNRKAKTTPEGKSLWNYANAYFQPRNPMLYRVLHEKEPGQLAIVGINPQILHRPHALVALGNADSGVTEILPASEGIRHIAQMWDIIGADWWNAMDGSKRKIMAECLVPDSISPENIYSVFVASHEIAHAVKEQLPSSIPVIPEPAMFFRPARRYRLTERLFLAEGDMFFSTMHTLTVSVNLVGIMGKGLASRAKYQFPDVYVFYQDVCRRRKLQMGKPALYKRESFVDEELADDPASLPELNANKWFLLFPTKRHWRENSDLAGIEAGLRWLKENYESQDIRSLALPALGCGLGKLEWREVGPIMCQALANLNIEVAIYLPRERETPAEYLSPRYLLGSSAE